MLENGLKFGSWDWSKRRERKLLQPQVFGETFRHLETNTHVKRKVYEKREREICFKTSPFGLGQEPFSACGF